MRRTLLAVALLSLVVGVALRTAPGAPAAQQATPVPNAPPNEAHTPVFLELLGSAPAAEAPGKRLMLFRLTLAPGATMLAHMHPGQLIVSVESGTLGYTVLGADGESVRGGAGTPTASDLLPVGTEVTFEPGEFFVEPPGLAHAYRNPGNEPVVLLVAALVAANQILFQDVLPSLATPAA